LQAGAGCELDSKETGDLPPGTRVRLLSSTILPDGTQRAHLGDFTSLTPLGWVSRTSKSDGKDNLLCADNPAFAAAVEAAATAPTPSRLKPSSSAASVPRPESNLFVARNKLKLRTGSALDSPEAGELAMGTRVLLMEKAELPCKTRRARVEDTASEPLGWISLVGRDGQNNLVAEWRR